MFLRPSLSASGRCALLLLVVAFVVLLLAMQRDLNVYDEGLVLVGAMRVADGEISDRDFYANYGPAQFYVLAGLFKLFAPSILGERLLYETLPRHHAIVCSRPCSNGVFGILPRTSLARSIAIVWVQHL